LANQRATLQSEVAALDTALAEKRTELHDLNNAAERVRAMFRVGAAA